MLNPDKIKAKHKRYYERHKLRLRKEKAAMKREFRRKYPDLAKALDRQKHIKYRKRRLTYGKVKWAVDTKKLKRPEKCSKCGVIGKIYGHHPDYNKPLEVVWLCMDCHMDIHRLTDCLDILERRKK